MGQFSQATNVLGNNLNDYAFGANFRFTSASVPEPSSLVTGLISLALVGGFVAFRKALPFGFIVRTPGGEDTRCFGCESRDWLCWLAS